MLEDVLLEVNKPGRYIGQEWNVAKKDFDKSSIKFALCFPDLYEVGMSNLGMRILYGILNNAEDVCCERFFSPDIDMEKSLHSKQLQIFSLESQKKLKEFDFIGFSLGYELSYTNVLNILELGAIPLQSSLRSHAYPLVIGGGPCALNPEPMHDFFDLFVIGEAEEVILQIVELYRRFKEKFKASRISKQDLLVMLASIEGVYVPSLYEVIYNPEGKIAEFKPKFTDVPSRVKKRLVNDLDQTYFPLNWLIPYIPVIHDRITLEIMRGCPNTCRFCQARAHYFPFRQRGIKNILDLARQAYQRTGYEEVSLGGLSVSDYPHVAELLFRLVDLFKENSVSVSLPSLKPKTMMRNFPALIASIKKTGLTFAPEAATERLREIIAKDFDTEDFFTVIQQAYLSGYQRVKLYFMIGLPTEEQGDLAGIIDFSDRVSQLRKNIKNHAAEVNVSINNFIPKPHTPMQWCKMENIEGIKYKQDYIRSKATNKRLKLKFHNRYMSFLEGVLARGDRRLSEVVLLAFGKGARFDAWSNHFRFERWIEAFDRCKINPNSYLEERSVQDLLPWDFLDIGISKKTLVQEFNKLIALS
jgi:radical SAM family uncharacterized protein